MSADSLNTDSKTGMNYVIDDLRKQWRESQTLFDQLKSSFEEIVQRQTKSTMQKFDQQQQQSYPTPAQQQQQSQQQPQQSQQPQQPSIQSAQPAQPVQTLQPAQPAQPAQQPMGRREGYYDDVYSDEEDRDEYEDFEISETKLKMEGLPRGASLTGYSIANPPGLTRSRRPASIASQRRLELMQNPPKTLRGVFENYQVSEIALNNWLRKRPILISDTQTVERALSRINAHDVHSLPVVDMNKDVIGVIDVLDIATAVAQSLKSKMAVRARVPNELMMKTVASLFLQKHTRSYIISNKTSLWKAAEGLVQTKQERFLIVDRDGDMVISQQNNPESSVDGLLTASDIIRFLSQNVFLMRHEPVFMKRLRDLGLGTRTPKTVYMNDIVGQVFCDMAESGVSGVAVLDANGKLHANLSASDLKSLTRKNVNILNQTVENFLVKDRKRGWWLRPIVVTQDESLISCVLQFVCAKVHRMYIVDEEFRPVGEINHHDILQELIKLK